MAWLPLATAAMGAIAGKAKNDRAQQIESSDRNLAAQTQRYSPWTGMSAQPIRHAGSQFGDVFGGGVNGAMMGSNIGTAMKGMGGAEAPVNPYDKATTGGFMGSDMGASYDPNTAGNYLPRSAPR